MATPAIFSSNPKPRPINSGTDPLQNMRKDFEQRSLNRERTQTVSTAAFNRLIKTKHSNKHQTAVLRPQFTRLQGGAGGPVASPSPPTPKQPPPRKREQEKTPPTTASLSGCGSDDKQAAAPSSQFNSCWLMVAGVSIVLILVLLCSSKPSQKAQ